MSHKTLQNKVAEKILVVTNSSNFPFVTDDYLNKLGMTQIISMS